MGAKLTVSSIEKLPVCDKRTEVSDGVIPALRVVIQPSGSKSFAVRFRLNGQAKKFTIGPIDKVSLSDARDAARRVLSDAHAGRDPMAAKTAARFANARSPEDSVGKHLDDFLRRHVATLKSKDAVERLFNVELKAWRHRQAKDISKRDVISLIEAVHDRGSPTTARRLLANLKKFFSWLLQRDVLQLSPCTGVKAPSADTARTRTLTNQELASVLRAAEQVGYPFGTLVRTLILTGARRGEVAEMRWSELRLFGDDPVWTIPASRTKNGREHSIPLSDEAVTLLKGIPPIVGSSGSVEFVFTTSGNSPVSGFSKAKKTFDRKLVEIDPERSRINDWHLHDLRRTFATGCGRLDISPHVIERCLNHVSGSFGGIVGVYQRHDYFTEMKNAFAKWGETVRVMMEQRHDVR